MCSVQLAPGLRATRRMLAIGRRGIQQDEVIVGVAARLPQLGLPAECGGTATRARLPVSKPRSVILDRPTLKDFRRPIREKLAEALGLGVGRVSVKFKTAENVGPVGEGKSAEAQAIVTVEKHDWAGA